MTNDFTAYDPAGLPAPVVPYLDAHNAGLAAEATRTFAPDATVLDDGNTYRGRAEIEAWIEQSSTEYEVTQTRIGQNVDDVSRPVVKVRIDGNFPGGTATINYRFELEGGLITHLSIGA